MIQRKENGLSNSENSLKEDHRLIIPKDLRNASTTPLNFTKSINLALSERGINSMRESQCEGLLEDVLAETIPMHARMIHGRRKNGEIYEESQAYDANGRVSLHTTGYEIYLIDLNSVSKPSTVRLSTNASWMHWRKCLM